MGIKIGFTLIGRGHWSGGENYLRNMLGMIRDFLPQEIEPYLFLSSEQAVKIGGNLTDFLAAPPIIDERVMGAGQGGRAAKALLAGSDGAMATLFQKHNIDVVFESAEFYGSRFPISILSWIPDFQHRHMSHLFPKAAWWKRDLGFRCQTNGSRLMMLSSEDALRDCETFYPKMKGRSVVVRFAIDLDPAEHYARIDQAKAEHGLPDKFFYLPNQYWSHKNHRVVIEALGLLASRGELGKISPVFLTGRTEDPRDPSLFKRDMERAEELGVSGHFKHLGLIPYADVFALNAGCRAMINPSRFEGWSTPVEEAKALGTPMILSNISLHQEQAPAAKFFDPNQAEALADILSKVSQKTPERAAISDLQSAQYARRKDYAKAFLDAVQDAKCLRR